MSIAAELDEWADSLAVQLPDLVVTRDPGNLSAPVVLLIEAPDGVTSTLAGTGLELPVCLIGRGDGGKATVDELLEHLPAVLTALRVKTASYELHASDRPAYRIVTNLTIVP